VSHALNLGLERKQMEFTGERYVPGAEGFEELYIEHMSRYVFASDIAPGRGVLDVGCGCGYGTNYMALRGAKAVVGIDTSEEAVSYAATRYKRRNLHFAVMDARCLGLGWDFDLITCFEMIEHVADAPALLRSVYDTMAEDGVFLVSTPNRVTYVAGGEDGKNPFHVREYDKDEFLSLLRLVFPHVDLLGQFWIEGMALSPHPELLQATPARSARLPDENGLTGPGAIPGEPPYFMAICAKHDTFDSFTKVIAPVILHTLSTRYERLKGAARKLERDFDDRGRWAIRLDRENREKDKTIVRLQVELDKMRKEFDVRGKWARSLETKVGSRDAVIQDLRKENVRLRRLIELVEQRT
jgi:SAM-dependent methyltransferase